MVKWLRRRYENCVPHSLTLQRLSYFRIFANNLIPSFFYLANLITFWWIFINTMRFQLSSSTLKVRGVIKCCCGIPALSKIIKLNIYLNWNWIAKNEIIEWHAVTCCLCGSITPTSTRATQTTTTAVRTIWYETHD